MGDNVCESEVCRFLAKPQSTCARNCCGRPAKRRHASLLDRSRTGAHNPIKLVLAEASVDAICGLDTGLGGDVLSSIHIPLSILAHPDTLASFLELEVL